MRINDPQTDNFQPCDEVDFEQTFDFVGIIQKITMLSKKLGIQLAHIQKLTTEIGQVSVETSQIADQAENLILKNLEGAYKELKDFIELERIRAIADIERLWGADQAAFMYKARLGGLDDPYDTSFNEN